MFKERMGGKMTQTNFEEFILVPKAYYNELLRLSDLKSSPVETTVAEVQPNAKYLTTDDVMEMLGVSRTTIKNWRDNKLLPYRKFGRSVRFTMEDVKKLEREKLGKSLLIS